MFNSTALEPAWCVAVDCSKPEGKRNCPTRCVEPDYCVSVTCDHPVGKENCPETCKELCKLANWIIMLLLTY